MNNPIGRNRFAVLIVLIVASIAIVSRARFDERIKVSGVATPPAVSSNRMVGSMDHAMQGRSPHDAQGNPSYAQATGRRIDITNFEPDDFDGAWAEAIRTGETEVDRLYNLSLVVGRMSRIGDPEVILAKIHEEFGPGRSRCHLIGTLFMGSTQIDSLSKVYANLDFPDEMEAARHGISQSLCMVDSPELIDRKKYAFLGEQFENVFEKTLELYVSRFQSKPVDQLSSAVRKAIGLQSSDESKRNLLSKLVTVAPFDCWDQLSANKLELPPLEQKKLFTQMFGRDAARAMNQIASSSGSERYFSTAFQQWLGNDARKPIEWLDDHKQTLSLAQKESAMQGIAEYSARQGDCNAAWQWAGQITDPDLRKAAEGKVWSMERDNVRREVSKNPELVIQSMIAGNSKHDDYWIEEAMGAWVAKDFDKAQDWFQQNWPTLPAAKSQYIAAAFANQAVQQGDVVTARQWAAHITDAKTKQRIEATINKAEGQNGK